MKQAMLRKQGPILEVSADGLEPLPEHVAESLAADMRYRHVVHLYGKDILVERNPDTGKKTITRVLVEHRRLFRYDNRGRLLCGTGYIDRVYAGLRAQGYEVGFLDLTKYPNQAALEPRWDRLAKRPEFTPSDEDKACVAAILASGGTSSDVAMSRRVKQDEIFHVVARRVSKRLGGTVQSTVGTGKSVMLGGFSVLFPKATIAVIVPGRDNFNKTWRHLTRYVPSVGRVGCGKKEFGRVTVYTPESAHHIRENTDLLLFDEVHKAGAECVSRTLGTVAPHAVRFGFTATPTGRMDGTDARLEGMFGPVVYEMSYPEAVQLGLVVPIEVRWIDCNFDTNPAGGREGIWRKKYGIWTNDARNEAIARYARKHPDDQVLVIADKIEHVLRLHQKLPGFTPVYGQQDLDYFEKFRKQGLVDEDFVPVSHQSREAMRKDFETGALRRVICTAVWGTGVSFDGLSVMFRADASGSPILDEQYPGRVCRIDAANADKIGILYDCNDLFDSGFRAAAAKRRKNYEEKGWVNKNLQRRHHLAV